MMEGVRILTNAVFPGNKWRWEKEEKERRVSEGPGEKFSKQDVAAVLQEPVMGSGGIISLPDQYQTRLFDLIRRYGVVLDYGRGRYRIRRTGYKFASEKFSVKPIFYVLSEGGHEWIMPMGPC